MSPFLDVENIDVSRQLLGCNCDNFPLNVWLFYTCGGCGPLQTYEVISITSSE